LGCRERLLKDNFKMGFWAALYPTGTCVVDPPPLRVGLHSLSLTGIGLRCGGCCSLLVNWLRGDAEYFSEFEIEVSRVEPGRTTAVNVEGAEAYEHPFVWPLK
jgi:hypothetical protein